MEMPWELDLIGDGPLQLAVEAQARRLGIAERVRFLGLRRDVAERLAQSQLFVLATRWEGFPYTILEAMRAGLPVVASDVGGVREAVVHGETGLLVPRGDEQALRQRLSEMLASVDLRQRLGAAGRRRFEATFTFARMIDKTAAVYSRGSRAADKDWRRARGRRSCRDGVVEPPTAPANRSRERDSSTGRV